MFKGYVVLELGCSRFGCLRFRAFKSEVVLGLGCSSVRVRKGKHLPKFSIFYQWSKLVPKLPQGISND